MLDIEKIEKKLNQKIDETLLALRVDSVVNTIIKLEKHKDKLKNGYFNISTHEKSMRKSFFYDPYDCFDGSFEAQFISNDDEDIQFKNEFKQFFLFGMRHTGIRFELDFHMDVETYNANELLNELANRFFDEISSTKQSKKEIFNEVVKQLKDKNHDVSSYSYHQLQKKVKEKEDTSPQKTMTKEDLFNELTQIEGTSHTKKKL